ncbi:hypothetical protein GCM10020258_55450 [Sphingomonas yabuuchiae]
MPKLALYVPLKAKPGKERDVANFLTSALPLVQAEAGTLTWYAIEEGPGAYAIFDTFDTEEDRQAHLDGKVAAALMDKAEELFLNRRKFTSSPCWPRNSRAVGTLSCCLTAG